MKKKMFAIILVILVLTQVTFAQNVSKVGTTAAKFLGIPVGARATAMGTAFVSIANDATATFWNPGALDLIRSPEVHISHAEWFGGLSFDFGAVAYPLGISGSFGTAAVSYTMLTMPEERVTTIDDPEGEFSGKFDAGSYAVGLSYSKSLTDRFAIGGTVKYIVERIYNSKATSFAIDLGTVYETPFKGVRLGVSISNFGPKMQMNGEDLIVQKDVDPTISGNNESVNALLMTDSFDLPLMMRIGIAWDMIRSDFNRLTFVADAMHPNDNTESLSLGAEYAFLNELFFLRGGYKNMFLENNEGRFTLGFGINYKLDITNFKFDYAFSEFEHLQNVHLFSLGVTF